MKKYITPLIFIAFALIAFTSCNKDEKIELDFDITLPSNWFGYLYSNEGRIYDAARKPLSDSDTLVEGLVIYKNHVPGYTLDYYYASLKQQIVASEAYDSLTYDVDTVVNSTDFVKMVSHEFLRYYSSTDTITLGAVTERYFFYENDYGYNMTFVAVDSLYPGAKPSFDSIINSFHYKN